MRRRTFRGPPSRSSLGMEMSTSGDERSTPDAGPPCGHVFVSHSHDDRAVAGRLVHRLEGHGIKCWIAPRDIRPGEDWAAALAEAVETASALVFLLSATSAESSHCAKELDLAQGAGVAQVPVRLDVTLLSGGMKYRLSGRHWLDSSDDEEAWVDALADVLEPGRRNPVATVPPSPPSQTSPPRRGAGETPRVDRTVASSTPGTASARRAALTGGSGLATSTVCGASTRTGRRRGRHPPSIGCLRLDRSRAPC